MTLPRTVSAALVVALLLPAAASAGVRVATRDEPLPTTYANARSAGASTLAPRAAPLHFNLVGLHWRGAGDVWFRTAPAAGAWSSWRPARPEGEDLPDAGTQEARARRGWKLGNPYWTGAARRIQYRLAGPVAALRAHFLWSAPRPAASARRQASAIPSAPAIVTRAQWGADESIVREPPSYAERVAFSVVHHTAGTRPSSPSQSAAIVRGVQAYHVRSNGWNDIGYNFLVDPFGQVFEGRSGGITRNVIGAHAQGFNTGSVGVAVLGTYETGAVAPAAREALAAFLAWRLDVAHVDPASRLTWVSGGSPKWPAGAAVSLRAVSGHRDVGSTACPGAALYAELGSLAGDAASRGLPKLFDPRVQGSVGGPVRFTARLSEARAWTVSVTDGAGALVARGSGHGTAVDWTWDATGAAPGRYSYAIEAGPDVRAALGPVGGAVPLEISTLTASPAVVTPNGDGVDDTARVDVGLTAAATLALWLEDAGGERAATIVGGRAVGAGTARIVWRGRDAAGQPVPDGRYTLVAEATTGAETDSRRSAIVVDRTLGHLGVRPSAFSPNGDGRRDVAALSYRLEREATVRLRVLAGARVVATLTSGRQDAGAHEVTWDGTSAGARTPDGRLRVVVEATTTLGTRRLARELALDTRGPRVGGLVARRSRGGTLVRFRLSERARLAVRFGARTLRYTRNAGAVTLWRRARPATVAVVAVDAAENTSRRASVRVRR